MEIEDYNNNPLPPNFDKYSNIIKYFHNNGLDCLSSLQEQFRFFIRYIYVIEKYISESFHIMLDERTKLSFKNNYMWGCWKSHSTHRLYDYYYDINKLEFYHSSYKSINGKSVATKEFLYEELSRVSDMKVNLYVAELCGYFKIKHFPNIIDNIIITNKFNDCKIIVQKDNFQKICGYNTLLEDYKYLDTFVIDIEFNDRVAKDISNMIDEQSIGGHYFSYTIEELEQKFSIIDFLQINMSYDPTK